jgi:hypothetical protein
VDIALDELNGLQLLRIIRNGSFGKSPPPVIVCLVILNEEVWTRLCLLAETEASRPRAAPLV